MTDVPVDRTATLRNAEKLPSRAEGQALAPSVHRDIAKRIERLARGQARGEAS